MTYQEIIKESNNLTSDQKQLLSYHLFSTLDKDKRDNILQLFYYNSNFDFPEIELKKQKKERIFGMLKGKIKMSDDFDEPLEEFKDYM